MKENLIDFRHLVASGEELNPAQIEKVASMLTSEQIEDDDKAAFLREFSKRGETDKEFCGFVTAFRSFSKNPKLEAFSDHAIDLCGTGGDRSGSFNISSFVSILLAAGGVRVIKHGNRSISSKCGSADLLEGLGIRLETEPAILQASMEELNFCFLFAPHFHPSFKNLAPVRQKLASEGIITMFNRLGPCLNPASPAHHLLGVYDPAFLNQIAYTLKHNGGESGWVVHGYLSDEESNGVDELTACGLNLVKMYGTKKESEKSKLLPSDWKQTRCSQNDLLGGSLKKNLMIVDDLLNGTAHPGLKSTVLINASAALYICGKVDHLEVGVDYATQLLEDGSVKNWIDKAANFYSR